MGKDTQGVKKELQRTLYVLDFFYICSLFLVANNKSILKFIRKFAMDYHLFALFFQLLVHLPTN